ncbi:leucine-rich repeat and IQ domain-containing protein 1 isoform X4 [Catharus ustulatus]|uniref:leucine-rich repeat and IQ domain-containing protein 1 isoform X4 n=1 Tax=Catharus ustulatus TaxID=91951 RepID=UPI001409FAFF|nr:leucine-rich repeat and IQ domain-containing protein 1 isoform X4 [Catharus ustulatus]
MSEDIEAIEKELEMELDRVSISSFGTDDPDSDVSDEPSSDSETDSDDLPESVVSYLNFIKRSNQDAEKLILQDMEGDIYEIVSCYPSESNEDSKQFNEKILLEVENEDLKLARTPDFRQSISDEMGTDDHFFTAGLKMNISLAHCEVEECKPALELEDEKMKKWNVERESREKKNEEEHARRLQHLEQFEAERIKLDHLLKKRQAAIEDELQKEEEAWRDKMRKHKELILKLQLQMEEEKKALEEQKAKERQQLAEQQNTAAVKIQARFRAFLVRKKYAPILKQWKYEMRKKQKILEEIEQEMKEREEELNRRMEENRLRRKEERKRQELERQEYLKQLRRCEEYEKKKESLRLEREKQLQIRREEEIKLEPKRAEAVMSENVENNIENIKKDNKTENVKVIREEKEELNKEVEEQKEKHAEMMDETNNRMIPAERNLTPSVLDSEKEHSSQVTTLTLEDLPACSLSTLSECSNLQVLTLRRCGLVALEGLSSCKDLKYINVEENDIQVIDCANLENLCILILNKNCLSSVYGLDGCKNLQNLELSYNRITRIGGLESLKNLQRLLVDHNQLINTKGLCEVPTLIHLDCSFNHLAQVEGIENCGLLQVLKLQGNNLQELPRLENHVLLRELYLDDNSISSMRMLSLYWLPLLQILLLSQNRLTDLVPLNSFIFLEKLDIKNNCLSDVKDVRTWFSGCHKLKELSLSGNPLLQEKNWRSSVLEVLPSLQLLDGEILTLHTLPTTEKTKASELRTFLQLCQVQIEENIQLKKKAAELEVASSIDSALQQCWYFNQLMKLSIKHRYVHEYGELSITDRDGPETLQNHLKQTSTGCLQENNLFIMGVTENKQVLLDPSKRWIATSDIQGTFINSSIPVHQKENRDQIMRQKNTESCINYSVESKGNNNMSDQLTLKQSVIVASDMGRNFQHFGNDTERLHMAACSIQSFWRRYHAQRKNDCNKMENHQFVETLRQKHEAATVIQAFWKGFLLRKKLASALADVKSDEVEDEYEEINVDAFTLSEATLEKEWLTLDSTRFPSKTLLLSNQLHWPKKFSRPSDSRGHSNSLPLAPQEVWQCANRPHSCSAEKIHFHTRSGKETMSQLSNWKEKKEFLFMSEKEEKISEEWGFKDISTAQLMLKRAHKMKPKKCSNKSLDPAVRLALFKNNENKHLSVKPPGKTQPISAGYFEGKKNYLLDTALDEKLQRKDFTYQWLHAQLLDYEAVSSRNTKCCHFLPELDPAICDNRQVQLVASPVSREDMDLDLVSMTSGSALTENREKNNPPHRHSARSSKNNISSPEKSCLGPSHRERISFRDRPVQLSGGWGAGKKRQKFKNIN